MENQQMPNPFDKSATFCQKWQNFSQIWSHFCQDQIIVAQGSHNRTVVGSNTAIANGER